MSQKIWDAADYLTMAKYAGRDCHLKQSIRELDRRDPIFAHGRYRY